MESDVITLQDIFEFKIESFAPDGTINGHLKATGLRPVFLQSSRSAGSTSRPASSRTARPANVAVASMSARPLDRPGSRRRARGVRRHAVFAADDSDTAGVEVVEAGSALFPDRIRPLTFLRGVRWPTARTKVGRERPAGDQPVRPVRGRGGRIGTVLLIDSSNSMKGSIDSAMAAARAVHGRAARVSRSRSSSSTRSRESRCP